MDARFKVEKSIIGLIGAAKLRHLSEPILIHTPGADACLVGKSFLHNAGERDRALAHAIATVGAGGGLFCESMKRVDDIKRAFDAMGQCGLTACEAGAKMRSLAESGLTREQLITFKDEQILDPIDHWVDKDNDVWRNSSTKEGFNEKEITKRRNKNKVARKSRRKNK